MKFFLESYRSALTSSLIEVFCQSITDGTRAIGVVSGIMNGSIDVSTDDRNFDAMEELPLPQEMEKACLWGLTSENKVLADWLKVTDEPEKFTIVYPNGSAGDVWQGDQAFCSPFVKLITEVTREILSERFPAVAFLSIDDIDGQSGVKTFRMDR